MSFAAPAISAATTIPTTCARTDYGNSLHCAQPPHLFGGWAEYMYLLPGTHILRVPDDLPDHVAVLTEIMSVTHGVETAQSLLALIGAVASASRSPCSASA